MSNDIKVALYIRVSTEDQVELSPDAQKRLLIDYANKNNMFVDEKNIFMDEGISGRKAEKRPEFMKMIALAKSKEKHFSKILVWKFSRFARNQEESIVYKNMLKKDGVDVVSVSEPIVDGPFGTLIERIIEWMDEYYSIRLSSEVTRGMTEKALRGGIQHSPAFGYSIINNNYEIVESEAKIIRKIFEKFLSGSTYNTIAKDINSLGYRNRKGNMFEGRNIKYILENPVYCGKIRWNYSTQKYGSRKIKESTEWILKDGTHTPIISLNDFEKVTNIINSKIVDRQKHSGQYTHWLGGLLRCSSCGSTLTYTAYSKSSLSQNSKYKGYFLCNKYKKKSCTKKNYISIKDAEEVFITSLEYDLKCIDDGLYKEVNIKNVEEIDVLELKKQLANCDNKIKKAKDLYINGIDTLEEFSNTKKSILLEKDSIQQKINDIDNRKIDKNIMTNNIYTAISLIKECPDILKINTFLKSFIERIVIDRAAGTFDIYYFE